MSHARTDADGKQGCIAHECIISHIRLCRTTHMNACRWHVMGSPPLTHTHTHTHTHVIGCFHALSRSLYKTHSGIPKKTSIAQQDEEGVVCVCVCVCVCVRVCAYTCVYVYVRVFINVYIHIHTLSSCLSLGHLCIHAHVYTYT